MRNLVKMVVRGALQAGWPGRWRNSAIRAMIQAEADTKSPRDAAKWLLDLNDLVARLVDRQCFRWGDGVHIKHELMTGIHSFFYERIPSGSVVLDVGCGYGAVAYSIVQHTDAQVVGVDFKRKSIEFARQRYSHPNLRFVEGDVTQSLPVAHVDVVVLSSIIEHISDRIGLLRQLVSLYEPKLFLIRVPTLERHYFTALKRELGVFYFNDPTHVIEYDPEKFEMEMEEAGLQVRHMEIRWGDIWAECVFRRE